ncbi:MAG: PqqD family protein [Actinomycetes bacterium]
MLRPRKFFGSTQSARNRRAEEPAARRCWATPSVHTLMDIAKLPRAGDYDLERRTPVVREWDLLGYGVLMTLDGVLHALDPIAYRAWQLHKQHRPDDEVAFALTAEWEVDYDLAHRGVTAVLSRLGEPAAAGV